MIAAVRPRQVDAASPQATHRGVAERGGRVVGSVGARISPVRPGVASVGFLDLDPAEDDWLHTANTLLAEAELWARRGGARCLYGPMNGSTWYPYRLRLDASPECFAWEPTRQPCLLRCLQSRGFRVDQTYHSEATPITTDSLQATRLGYEQALARGYSFRPIDPAVDLPLLHSVSSEGFQSAHLFEPIDYAAFRDLYAPLAERVDWDLAFWVIDSAGEPAGFLFGFEDQAYLVVKTIVVRPGARGQGLSNALWYLAARTALQERGVERTITALARSGALSESYARRSRLLWRHEYALLRKDLVDRPR